jgi:hypothetical protein
MEVDMNVTVYVWKLRPDNPGHVSLQIGSVYVSYWPKTAAGKKDVKLGETHDVGFPSEYKMDRRLEHKDADEKRELTGLDTAHMIEAWEAFKKDPVRYNMVDHNCSTVIAALLELGSGVKPSFVSKVAIDDHAANWAQRLFLRVRFFSSSIKMWTPDSVLRYAEEIAAKAHKH